MDIEKIICGLKYHTLNEPKKDNLEHLLSKMGFLSPRQQDMKYRYIDSITYHTSIEKPSLYEQIKEKLVQEP